MATKVTVKFRMQEGCEDLEPKKAHHNDAAFDLRAKEDVDLVVGRSMIVPTGLFIELPVGFEAQVRPRSGLAIKHDLTLTNSPGTIDAGYRGEVGIIMYNHGKETFHIKRGERIAQMVICELPEVDMVSADELSETKRGGGGFGSTGKH
ncbi:MAG: dUTP diphosphatase [Lentisphaerae bacterium]|nr:dUTP diphosphatase [Lentisphaerota bacterium]MCP4101613.1 dUTP diphosphatase [Lentisphaerota bacterium]